MSSTRAEARPTALPVAHGGGARRRPRLLSLVGCSDVSAPPAPRFLADPGRTGIPIPPDLDEAFTATLDAAGRAPCRPATGAGFLDGHRAARRRVRRPRNAATTTTCPAAPGAVLLRPRPFQHGARRRRVLGGRRGDPAAARASTLRPVVTRDRFRFARPTTAGTSSARPPTPSGRRTNDIQPQPWDMVPIEVRDRDGVLGIFDEESVAAAGADDGLDRAGHRRRVGVRALRVVARGRGLRAVRHRRSWRRSTSCPAATRSTSTAWRSP